MKDEMSSLQDKNKRISTHHHRNIFLSIRASTISIISHSIHIRQFVNIIKGGENEEVNTHTQKNDGRECMRWKKKDTQMCLKCPHSNFPFPSAIQNTPSSTLGAFVLLL